MGVLSFDSVGDAIKFTTLAQTLRDVSDGAWTVAVLCKITDFTHFGGLSYLLSGGGAGTAEAGISFSSSADSIVVDEPGVTVLFPTDFSSTTATYLFVASKGAGSVTPRLAWKPAGGSWTHEDGNVALADQTDADQLQIGTWQDTDNFEGFMGIVGWWEGAMSDAHKEALGANWRTSDMWNSAHGTPKFLAELNVAAASVVDLAENATGLTVGGAPTLDAGETLGSWTFDAKGASERPAAAPTNLWDFAGIMLFGLDDNSAAMDDILDWCVENKFKWVALQCFNDTALIEQTQIPIWKAEIQSRDLIFGLWGVHHDDPTGDAGRASDQINLWEADFYIANAEIEYKTDGPGTRAHSATFVNAFRALQPEIRSAFCTYGAIANDVGQLGSILDVNAGVMDFKTWYDNGFHFLPQAYASDPVYEVHRVIQHYRRCNVPFTHIHPMAGIYVGGDTYDGADYRGFFTGLVNTEWEMTIQADSPAVFYKLQDTSGNPQDSSPNGLGISTVAGTPDYSSASILDRVSSIRMTGGETLSRAVFSTATNNMSAEYLFQRQAQGANDQKIFYNGNSGTDGWGLLCNSDGTFRVLCGGVAFQNFADSGGAFAIDAWYHIVIVRDATVWKYYLNGSLHTPNAGTGTPLTPTGNFQINDGSIQIAGCMFAMYNTVLTPAQIARRYAWLTGNPCLGPQHTKSAYGFSLFLGETGGDLGTVVEQDYIDLGLSITSDKTAEALASVKQSGYGYRRKTVAR